MDVFIGEPVQLDMQLFQCWLAGLTGKWLMKVIALNLPHGVSLRSTTARSIESTSGCTIIIIIIATSTSAFE